LFFDVAFGLIGGLGLFIFGLQLMSEGMQKAAGDQLRKILEILTSNPLVAVLTGIVVTVLVQSSTSTTVMLVGFVNAGLMSLAQAVGVIFGANIGTTVTAQVLSFDLTEIALPAVGFGFFLTYVGRSYRQKQVGQAILGFGLLFLGMQTMSGGLSPLRDYPPFLDLLARFADYSVLGIFAGALFTMLVQSSSATTGVVIALSLQDMLVLRSGVALILGSNIGTCITAFLASVGTNIAARRTALAHTLFNVLGVLIFLLFISPFTRLVSMLGGSLTRQVANAHTIFNISIALLFLPFINYFVRIVRKLTPSHEQVIRYGPQFLDDRMIDTPQVALVNARKEILRMARIARSMVKESIQIFFDTEDKKIDSLMRKEDIINELETEATSYLVKVSRSTISTEQHEELTQLMHMVNDIERIGDHSENIVELARQKRKGNIPFSEDAKKEIKEIFNETDCIISKVVKALDTGDFVLAMDAINDDEIIDEMEKQLRQNHIERLNKSECIPEAGIIFTEILSNFERIADHATNITEALIGRVMNSGKGDKKNITD